MGNVEYQVNTVYKDFMPDGTISNQLREFMQRTEEQRDAAYAAHAKWKKRKKKAGTVAAALLLACACLPDPDMGMNTDSDTPEDGIAFHA